MPQYDWKWSAENDVTLYIQIKDGGGTNMNSVNVIENVQLPVNLSFNHVINRGLQVST